jgi:diguanylate cyclase
MRGSGMRVSDETSMQVTRADGVAGAAFALADAYRPETARSPHAHDIDDLLQQALRGIAELARTLAMSHAGSSAARQQLSRLSKTVSRVGERALGLEQEVAQMRHFAYHDELTGLPNRSLLLDRLGQAVAQASRRNRPAALLLLDLDGFKSVNDRYGHAAGDQLLQRTAQRLLASTRNADTTARYGGDEFIVLLPEVDGKESATEVAQKIHTRLTEPFVIGGHSIAVTACIGIAVYPVDGTTPDDLIERADIAMYAAKARLKTSATSLRLASRATRAARAAKSSNSSEIGTAISKQSRRAGGPVSDLRR